MLGHLRLTHACLLLPGPPNLIMLLQAEQIPQSGCWQGSQTPHLLLFMLTSFSLFSSSLASCWGKKLSNMSLTNFVVVALVQDGFLVSFKAFRMSPRRQLSSCLREFPFFFLVVLPPFLKVIPARSISALMQGAVMSRGSSSPAESSKDRIWSQMNWAWCSSTSSVNFGRPRGITVVLNHHHHHNFNFYLTVTFYIIISKLELIVFLNFSLKSVDIVLILKKLSILVLSLFFIYVVYL